MEIGYTVWTWGLETEENLKTALKEMKELNYKNVENFIGMADMYYDRIDEFNALFKEYDLNFIAIYNYIRDINDDNVSKAVKYLDFCKKTGAKIMNIQAPPRNGKPSCEDLKKLADILNEIGKLAKTYDVTLCLHPHFESTVETADEIEFLAQNTCPDCVSFCFDTAHTLLGLMDPYELIEKYNTRIKYMHLKDEPFNKKPDTFRKNWLEGVKDFQRFYELGRCDVDFKEVVQALKNVGYDGYLVVELDTPSVSNYEGAKTSRKFLADTFGF